MFKRSFFPFSHRNTFIKKQQYSIKKCYLSTSNTIIQRKDDNCKEDASIVSIRNYIFPLLYKEGIKKNSVRLGTAFTLLIASKLLTIQVPLLFKEIIDSLSLLLKETSSSSSLAFPIPFDVWSISVGGILLAYASARIASSLSSEVKNYLFSSISLDVQRRIARESFSKLHSLPLSFHQGRDVGGLVRLVDRGIKGINFCSSSLLFNVVPTALEIGMVCVLLTMRFGPQYALLSLVGISSYTVVTLALTKWRTQFRRQMNLADTESSRLLHDTLSCVEVVKVFNGCEKETQEYDRILTKYNKANKLTTSSLGLLNFGQQTLLSMTLASIMFLSCQGISQGSLSLGDIVLVNGLIFQLSLPLNFLGSIYREMKQSITDMTGLLKLLTSNDSNISIASNDLMVSKGLIEIKNLSVMDSTKTLLDNLSITLKEDKIAIVGRSGGGKSTIARSLLGLIRKDGEGAHITNGTIEIDGQSVLLSSPLSQVTIVGQDSLLLDRSLWDNLTYGSLKPLKEEDVFKILDKLSMSEWKDRLGQRVGERGNLLSGGEKQRIAIARAIIKQPKIIIFDESTSQLDLKTERIVMDYLWSLKDCKMIFIAHRLNSIKEVDCIYVINEGKLVESGKHDDLLLRKNGIYSGLWSRSNDL